MRCEEIMKPEVECVMPTDGCNTAARKMRDLNVGFLPVCDEKGKVLGTVTDRDIAIRLVAQDGAPSCPVGDVMTREIVYCSPDDDVKKAAELMGRKHKSRIMVLGPGSKLLGVISLSDIAQREEEMAAAALKQVTEREAASVH